MDKRRTRRALVSMVALLTARTYAGLLRPAPGQKSVAREPGSRVATAAGIYKNQVP